MNRRHYIILITMAIISILLVVWVGWSSLEYFTLGQSERVFARDLHPIWKPSGSIGHALGIAASVLIAGLFLYPARKYYVRWRRWGSLANWLHFHILMGVLAPVLATYHANFKFNGLVALSYWSMILVALSGFVGRFIYIQIPRRVDGESISLLGARAQLREMLDSEDEVMREAYTEVMDSGIESALEKAGIGGILSLLKIQLTLGFRIRRIIKKIGSAAFKGGRKRQFRRQLRRIILFRYRLSFYSRAERLLHYWHIFHKPFAYTMVLILVIHVSVTLYMGYRWLF